jgi:hypothetical protein
MIVSTGINKGFGKDTSSIFLSPKRISVTVSAMTAKKLWKRSSEEGRSLSNLVAYILEEATASDSQD